jgi:hypothetical protein
MRRRMVWEREEDSVLTCTAVIGHRQANRTSPKLYVEKFNETLKMKG